jgi:hypothetical protein
MLQFLSQLGCEKTEEQAKDGEKTSLTIHFTQIGKSGVMAEIEGEKATPNMLVTGTVAMATLTLGVQDSLEGKMKQLDNLLEHLLEIPDFQAAFMGLFVSGRWPVSKGGCPLGRKP